jgi:hypothetical protein
MEEKIEKSNGCADFSITGLCRSHKLGIAEPDWRFGLRPSQYLLRGGKHEKIQKIGTVMHDGSGGLRDAARTFGGEA